MRIPLPTIFALFLLTVAFFLSVSFTVEFFAATPIQLRVLAVVLIVVVVWGVNRKRIHRRNS